MEALGKCRSCLERAIALDPLQARAQLEAVFQAMRDGVMVFDMTDPYCTLVLRGMENALYQSSFLPILTDVHNERSRFERYLEMLLDRRIEGLVVLANTLYFANNGLLYVSQP